MLLPGFLVHNGKRKVAEKSMMMLRGKALDYKFELNELMKQHYNVDNKEDFKFNWNWCLFLIANVNDDSILIWHWTNVLCLLGELFTHDVKSKII